MTHTACNGNGLGEGDSETTSRSTDSGGKDDSTEGGMEYREFMLQLAETALKNSGLEQGDRETALEWILNLENKDLLDSPRKEEDLCNAVEALEEAHEYALSILEEEEEKEDFTAMILLDIGKLTFILSLETGDQMVDALDNYVAQTLEDPDLLEEKSASAVVSAISKVVDARNIKVGDKAEALKKVSERVMGSNLKWQCKVGLLEQIITEALRQKEVFVMFLTKNVKINTRLAILNIFNKPLQQNLACTISLWLVIETNQDLDSTNDKLKTFIIDFIKDSSIDPKLKKASVTRILEHAKKIRWKLLNPIMKIITNNQNKCKQMSSIMKLVVEQQI